MIQKICHDIDTFDLEDLGVKTGDLEYGIDVREEYTSYENLSGGAVVHVNTSGYIGLAQVNTSSRMPARGVLDAASASGFPGSVVTLGPVSSPLFDFSGYIGRVGYVSNSGGIVHAPNSSGLYQVVGRVISGSGIYVLAGGVESAEVTENNLEYGYRSRLQRTAYENLSGGQAVHVNASGYIGMAQTNVSARMPAVGIMEDPVAADALGTVFIGGTVSAGAYNFSGYLGRAVFVSTSGLIRLAATSGQVQMMGVVENQSSISVSVGALTAV